MTEVFFTEPGHGDFVDPEDPLEDRVEEKLHDVSDDPGRFLKPLRSYDLYVLRVGDHRVIVDWNRNDQVVYVHAIGHRRNVYDRDL